MSARYRRFFAAAGLAVAAVLWGSPAGASLSSTFNGNGATGFGGPIGNGSLTITDDGAGNLQFDLNPQGGNLGGNAAVMYIDSKPGGVTDTSTLNDSGDNGRKIVSGINTGNPSRTIVSFSPGFLADYGISVEPSNFEGVFDLSNPTNFGFVTGNGIGGSSPYTVTITRTQLGLGPTDPFSVVVNEISETEYRSNETIGNSVVPSPADGGGNAGFNNPLNFTSAPQFTVPEPSTLSLLALGAIAAIRRRRRA